MTEHPHDGHVNDPSFAQVPGLTAGRGLAVLAGIIAIVVAAAVLRPLEPSTNDPDAASSVLFFQRITAGQHLESFTSTTAKPWLTVLYGATWAVTHDWRLLGIETLLAFGAAVAAAARLAWRLLGGGPAGLGAATFAVVGLVGSASLLDQVGGANSEVWALAAWLIAAVAMTAVPRRPWIAGIALLIGALCRIETWIILAVATLAIGALAWLTARDRRPADWPHPRTVAPLLIGWLAVPAMGVHDVLLTGDPTWWTRAAVGYTALRLPDLASTDPVTFLGLVAGRPQVVPAIVALAALGLVWLVRRRALVALLGLLALVPGVLVLLAILAARGIYVPARYLEQLDWTLTLLAGVGVGWLIRIALARWPSSTRSGASHASIFAAGSVLVAGLVAVIVVQPYGPMDTRLAATLHARRQASANAATVLPYLRRILDAETRPIPAPVPGPGGILVTDPTQVTVFVPRSLLNRLALDTEQPRTRLGDSYLAFRDAGPLAALSAGQSVYHDRWADGSDAASAPIEHTTTSAAGRLTLEPVVTDPAAGYWLLTAK